MNKRNEQDEKIKYFQIKLQVYQIVLGVLVLLFVFVTIYMVIKLNSRNPKGDLNLAEPVTYESSLKLYPKLDPTRNLMQKKDVITNIQPLRELLMKLAEQEKNNAKISLYIEYLNTGANISINQDEKIWPVSLAKLPMALLVMKHIENGKWKLSDQLDITDENLNSASGDLYLAGSENDLNIERLLWEMLVNSDNTAYRILKRNTTLSERTILSEEIGLGELFEENGKVSAKEYSRILRSLYTASYLNQEHSQGVLDILNKNNFKEFLSLGMPKEIIFSHKQGENVKLNVYADSGIVYLQNRPYIISVMVEPITNTGIAGKAYATNIFKEIADSAYKFFKDK